MRAKNQINSGNHHVFCDYSFISHGNRGKGDWRDSSAATTAASKSGIFYCGGSFLDNS